MEDEWVEERIAGIGGARRKGVRWETRWVPERAQHSEKQWERRILKITRMKKERNGVAARASDRWGVMCNSSPFGFCNRERGRTSQIQAGVQRVRGGDESRPVQLFSTVRAS